jgi:hypothetical protein
MKLSNPDITLTIRHAGPADVEALRKLAQLDSSRVPAGEVVAAEVGGELWAALSLDDGHAIADPFHFTDEIVSLLEERARQLRRPERRRTPRLTRLRPALG